ncbi:MAG: hypothetical protein QW561_03595 [Candidatus Aenigmatarchaeota archaeon]
METLGITMYLILFMDIMVRVTKLASRPIATGRNLGSPNGIPSIPTTLMAIRTIVTGFT